MTWSGAVQLLVAAVLAGELLATTPAGASTLVTVPDQTAVEVTPVQMLGTYFNPKGSTFDAVVKKDVVVNGYVIVKAGAKAQGTIVDSVFGDAMRMMPQQQDGPPVKRTGLFTVQGREMKGPPLEIALNWVEGVDGLKLRVGNITTNGDSNGNPAQTTPAPVYLLQTVTQMKKRSVFDANPTVDYSVKSGAGTIPPSQVFVALIKGPVHTRSAIKAGSDSDSDGFAH